MRRPPGRGSRSLLTPMTDWKVSVREAAEADLAWCLATDGHLDEADLVPKIRAHEIFIAEAGGMPAGLLRFDLMWSAVPFIAQVRVLEGYTRQALGNCFSEPLRKRRRNAVPSQFSAPSLWGPTTRRRSVGTRRWDSRGSRCARDVPSGTDRSVLREDPRTLRTPSRISNDPTEGREPRLRTTVGTAG